MGEYKMQLLQQRRRQYFKRNNFYSPIRPSRRPLSFPENLKCVLGLLRANGGKAFFLFLISCLLSLPLHAQSDADPISKQIQQKLSIFMQKNNIQGAAVELYVNGNLYEQYNGYADETKKDPVIRKTIFEIGSISKIMTSLLFAQEYDWAKMALDDPVTKYVKALPAAFNKISLRDLATHTSGLPFDPPGNVTTSAELKDYLNHWTPAARNQWRYSNTGSSLLGMALEFSTESDYGDLYRRHILNPLQMVNGVTVPKSLTKYYAQGYDQAGKPVAHVGGGIVSSAYGIKASVADMQKFLSAAIGLPGTPPRVFYPMRLTQSMFLKKNNNEYQGLAWQLHPIRNKTDINELRNAADHPDQIKNPVMIEEIYQRPVYSDNLMMDKTGMTEGFSAYIAVIPARKSGIVVLANKHIPDSAMIKLAREMLFTVTNLT